ncbi:AP-3 complex subunit mu-2-like [Rhopilema esculentum]|uniref:AP-3 complex subunit mu-2-like n=1 Tax=Rhopilema esculentum TaxID=499914 RepID=UPI0031D79A59
MPDLTMCFVNPRLLDDVSFHPCIRLKRWDSEKVLSFVPPDGNFCLLSYHITNSMISIPIFIRPSVSFISGSSGRFELTVGLKQALGKAVENVVITVQMPKQVLNCNLTPSGGQVSFDPVKKELKWDVGKILPQKQPVTLRGNLSVQTGVPPPDEAPIVTAAFSVSTLAVSGLKVSRLDVYGEKYKPFKGVKYMTKAGKFQIRT